MSHHKERAEKNCLNCGTDVAGRYCQTCGQENVVRHMHVGALIQHFIFDIFHFDGKFFDTVRYLLFKPGYVPAQYVQGRRQSYLDPVRMYLFTSALFFLLFVMFTPSFDFSTIIDDRELSKAERYDLLVAYRQNEVALKDSAMNPRAALADTTYEIVTNLDDNQYLDNDSAYPVQWTQAGKLYAARKIATASQPDSVALKKDNNLGNWWQKYKEKFDGDTSAVIKNLSEKMVARFPYLLFLSLPFFAAILKLLYTRRKRFYYFDHAVFTLYHYIFSFILLLIILGINKLDDYLHMEVLSWIGDLLNIAWFIHLFLAMKRFYAQGWGRTAAKFTLLLILASVVMLVLFAGFSLYSVFTF